MLIGVDFAAITEKHLQAFVDSRTSEDQDLDFKSKGYAPDNNGKREISKDIAALANHLGGLLIIGISEDGHGRANNLSPVRIQKGMELRIREILASCVSPMVQGVQVREVQSSANNELGYYLIAVPRSIDAPHGVTLGPGDRRRSMFWPVRNGTSTRFLHEAELATRYRNRFVLIQSQIDRLSDLHEQGASRREAGQITSLTLDIALAPGMAGSRSLIGESPTIQDFFGSNRAGLKALGIAPDLSNARVIPVRRRLRIETARCRLELHGDGAVWGRTFVGTPAASTSAPLRLALNEFENALYGLISAAGDFANWAGAAGDCLVSIRTGEQIAGQLLITEQDGGVILGQSIGATVPPAELTWPLADLGTSQGAGRAAYILAQDLEQDLGIVEPVLLQPDGHLVSRSL
jgi:Schlafen, AlbA_2